MVLGLAATLCFAQKYQPTTTWPYVYDDFTGGRLLDNEGDILEGVYNIHLLQGRLHFIDGDMIREVNTLDITSVTIGTDVYRNVGGSMMLVQAQSENGLVAKASEINATALNATGGAYGSSSSTLATQALTSLEFMNSGSGPVNHMNLKNSKDDGKVLPVIEKLYLVFGRNIVFATKKDVLAIGGVDKGAVNAFLKENKTKWKDPQSLIKLVDFISSEL